MNLKYTISNSNVKDLSQLLIIFDIDGILLRPLNELNTKHEFSKKLSELFYIIHTHNIKYAIATHGQNHLILQSYQSPIKYFINKLNQNNLKHIGMANYKYSQFKFNMLADIVAYHVRNYNIKYVMFFDDDLNNIHAFKRLSKYYTNLKFIPNYINLKLIDISRNLMYPLLDSSSFNYKPVKTFLLSKL